MTSRPVERRLAVIRDADLIVARYLDEAGANVALQFVDRLEAAYVSIGARPGTGSPRYGDLLGLPGLRTRRVRRFPYLIFYLHGPERIEAIRILHERSDILAVLSSERA